MGISVIRCSISQLKVFFMFIIIVEKIIVDHLETLILTNNWWNCKYKFIILIFQYQYQYQISHDIKVFFLYFFYSFVVPVIIEWYSSSSLPSLYKLCNSHTTRRMWKVNKVFHNSDLTTIAKLRKCISAPSGFSVVTVVTHTPVQSGVIYQIFLENRELFLRWLSW